MITHTNTTACLDALRELHARLRAMGLRSHFKAKYGAVYLMDHGVRFLMSEQNGMRFLTVGVLIGTEQKSGRVYRDFCFRSHDANTLIERALAVVARVREFDRQLGVDAVASFSQ